MSQLLKRKRIDDVAIRAQKRHASAIAGREKARIASQRKMHPVELSAMYKRTFTREEKLDYGALLDKASEEYHETILERVESQTEGGQQARIKKLEEDNRALSVANAFVVASEQAAQTEIIKLQKHNGFLEAHTATVSGHCEAEIGKLEEKTETLAKEKEHEISVLRREYGELSGNYDALLERANAVWGTQEARISVLLNDNSNLVQEKNGRDAAIQSKDALISGLEKEKSDLKKDITDRDQLHEVEISWHEGDMKKENVELKEQVRALHEELGQAKETIAASKASHSPALLRTPASTAQTGRSPSPLSEQLSGHPSPPMSSSRGSSVSNESSTVDGQSWLSLDPAPMTPVPAQQHEPAHPPSAFKARPPPFAGGATAGHASQPRTVSDEHMHHEESVPATAEQPWASVPAKSSVDRSGRPTPKHYFYPGEYDSRNDSLIFEDSDEEESDKPAWPSLPGSCTHNATDPDEIAYQKGELKKRQKMNSRIHSNTARPNPAEYQNGRRCPLSPEVLRLERLNQKIEEANRQIEERKRQAAARSSGRTGTSGAVDTPAYSNTTPPTDHSGQSRVVSNEVPATSPAPTSSTPEQTSANPSAGRATNTSTVVSRDDSSEVPTTPADSTTGPEGAAYQRDPQEDEERNSRVMEAVKQTPDDDPTPGPTSANTSTGRAIHTPAALSHNDLSDVVPFVEGESMGGSENMGDSGPRWRPSGDSGDEDSESEDEGDLMDEVDEDEFMSDGEPATTPPTFSSQPMLGNHNIQMPDPPPQRGTSRKIRGIGNELDKIAQETTNAKSVVPTGPKKGAEGSSRQAHGSQW